MKNWNKLAEVLKTEFSVISASQSEDKIKIIFWETLLARPMELEVIQMIENVRQTKLNLRAVTRRKRQVRQVTWEQGSIIQLNELYGSFDEIVKF